MKTRKGLSTFNDNGVINFKLYDTIILKIDGDNYTLNSGGWLTNHTKNCINDNLPHGYRIFQQENTWKIQTPEAVLKFEDNQTINVKG